MARSIASKRGGLSRKAAPTVFDDGKTLFNRGSGGRWATQQLKAAALAGKALSCSALRTLDTLRHEEWKFFDDVLVMTDDETLRAARLALVATLRDLILDIADISEIVTES